MPLSTMFHNMMLNKDEKTHDDVTGAQVQLVTERRKIAKDCAERFNQLSSNIGTNTLILEAIAKDLRQLGTEAGGTTAAQLEAVLTTLRAETEKLQPILKAEAGRLQQFVANCSQIDKVQATWKEKRVDYDVYRKKMNEIKTNPPKDAAKLHHKQEKFAAFEKEYNDANHALQQLAHQLGDEGSTVLTDTCANATKAFSHNIIVAAEAWQQSQHVQAQAPQPTAPINNAPSPVTQLPAQLGSYDGQQQNAGPQQYQQQDYGQQQQQPLQQQGAPYDNYGQQGGVYDAQLQGNYGQQWQMTQNDALQQNADDAYRAPAPPLAPPPAEQPQAYDASKIATADAQANQQVLG